MSNSDALADNRALEAVDTCDLSSNIPEKIFVTSNLIMELLDESHAAELYSLTDRNRLYLRNWLPWLDCCTQVDDTLQFIHFRKDVFSSNKGVTFAIIYNGTIAGIVSFNEIHWKERNAEIGYWIGEEFQGFGLVTRCVTKMVDLGFDVLHLTSVSISCATGNIKSQKIPLRLGFKETKIIPKRENLYGTFVDHIMYTIHLL